MKCIAIIRNSGAAGLTKEGVVQYCGHWKSIIPHLSQDSLLDSVCLDIWNLVEILQALIRILD
jgi:hypothetical protein